MQDEAKILVIDDDSGIGEMMKLMLEFDGYRVFVSEKPGEAEEIIMQNNIDLVILDIMMPDVGGLRVLDELAEEHSDTPVIVVTGKPEAADESRARLGTRNVFNKPFEVEDLLARVQEIIRGDT